MFVHIQGLTTPCYVTSKRVGVLRPFSGRGVKTNGRHFAEPVEAARCRVLLKPMPREGQSLEYNVHQEMSPPRRSAGPYDSSGGGGGGGGGGTVRKLLRSKNGLVLKRRAKLHASDSASNTTTAQRQKQSVRDLSVSDADAAASGALEYMHLDAHMKGEVGRAVATRHRNRVIVPLFSNLVIMPFLKNMLCSMARLQVENWAVVSLDMETCGALKARGFATARDSCVEPYQFRPLSDEAHKNESFKHGSPHFWRLVIQRPLWVQWMMQKGYSVLQCDVDIVWLHNPLLHFEKPAMQKYSAFYQSEQVYGMNCGFYFMRPDQAALGCVPCGMHWAASTAPPSHHTSQFRARCVFQVDASVARRHDRTKGVPRLTPESQVRYALARAGRRACVRAGTC